MILESKNLDWYKHCTFVFGEYVQAVDDPDPKNTNAPRTLDCSYLRPVESRQGGHELLHLQTNRPITRATVIPVPITPMVARQVHTIAKQDGMPKGLKIQTRTGVILFDSSSTAGVDYDQELFEEQKNDLDFDEFQSEEDDEDLEEADYDKIDVDELQDLNNDGRHANPNQVPHVAGTAEDIDSASNGNDDAVSDDELYQGEDDDDDSQDDNEENPEHEIEFSDAEDDDESEEPLFREYEANAEASDGFDARRAAHKAARGKEPTARSGRTRYVPAKFTGVHFCTQEVTMF